MILKLEEETWEHEAIPRIEKELGRKYTFICKDELCIDVDDLLDLLSLQDDEIGNLKEKVEKQEEKLKEIREPRRILRVGESSEY